MAIQTDGLYREIYKGYAHDLSTFNLALLTTR